MITKPIEGGYIPLYPLFVILFSNFCYLFVILFSNFCYLFVNAEPLGQA
jgi:hypothetical protein